MLELKGISKYYNVGSVNEMCLFQDFNLNIEKGELRMASLFPLSEAMVPERLPC